MKWFVLAVLLLTLLVVVSPAFAIYVPNNSAIVTVPVDSGWYDIYSQGEFVWGSTFWWAYADTEWIHLNETQWSEYSYLGYPDRDAELSVNGEYLDWEGQTSDGSYAAHTFSETHNYRARIYTVDKFEFQIYDSYIADNSGGLDITVAPVPEPSSLLALSVAMIGLIGLCRRKN